jgi:cytidine deaminase
MAPDPFSADPRRAERLAHLQATVGAALTTHLAGRAAARGAADDAGDRGTVRSDEVDALVAAFGLADVEEAMLLALPFAATLAQPPVSGYRVGAVGLEAETGGLLLGGNVEFPGTSLGHTIHGEGAVALRAFARGTSVATLALTRARPCAHCRQVLAEHAWAGSLRLIDPAGHGVALDDLYPWPFAPQALDQPPLQPGVAPWPGLRLREAVAPRDVALRLVAAGSRSHAPYSGVPAAIVVELVDGRLVAGAPLESVAYNPSLGPLQAAIPEVLARGHDLGAIRKAWLAVPAGRVAVDHAATTRQLLGSVAPDAPLHVITWA